MMENNNKLITQINSLRKSKIFDRSKIIVFFNQLNKLILKYILVNFNFLH